MKKLARKLDSNSELDLKIAAKIILDGGVVALPFNGIYGFFGNIESKEAAERIVAIKNRPKDRNLIIVSAPEFINEYVDFQKMHYLQDNLINLWKDVHALGVILPAGEKAPAHLSSAHPEKTILSIWTEYLPLRKIMNEFRKIGGKAFVGTSANHSGKPTHYQTKTLWAEFGHLLDAIVEADFSQMDEKRHKSTTVIDLTNSQPRLHRLGNVEESELQSALTKNLSHYLKKPQILLLCKLGIK